MMIAAEKVDANDGPQCTTVPLGLFKDTSRPDRKSEYSGTRVCMRTRVDCFSYRVMGGQCQALYENELEGFQLFHCTLLPRVQWQLSAHEDQPG